MKNLLFVIVTLLPALGFAQDTKTVITDSLKYQQEYDVLKAKPKIKHGSYTLSVAQNGKVLTTGFYKNNDKDSLWREYDNNAHVVVEGYYKTGRKYGEWMYFDAQHQVINKYDFTSNQLTYHQLTAADTADLHTVINQHDTITTRLDRAPVYLGGDAVMARPIIHNKVSPLAALRKELVGRVIISFVVDENGHTRNYHVDRPIGYGCDEEALRLVKQIPDNWLPGRLDNKNVAVIVRLPMLFNYSVATRINLPPTVVYH